MQFDYFPLLYREIDDDHFVFRIKKKKERERKWVQAAPFDYEWMRQRLTESINSSISYLDTVVAHDFFEHKLDAIIFLTKNKDPLHNHEFQTFKQFAAQN